MHQTARKPPPPPSPRVVTLRHADAEERLISRKIQNTEILTLGYQIEQQRQIVDQHRESAIAALLQGDTKAALKHLQDQAAPLLRQNELLRDLEKVERRDEQIADEDEHRLRVVRREEKAWRPGQ